MAEQRFHDLARRWAETYAPALLDDAGTPTSLEVLAGTFAELGGWHEHLLRIIAGLEVAHLDESSRLAIIDDLHDFAATLYGLGEGERVPPCFEFKFLRRWLLGELRKLDKLATEHGCIEPNGRAHFFVGGLYGIAGEDEKAYLRAVRLPEVRHG